ncbi:hypothetical protein HPB49_023750 [Dermacentor silvarum]|uniref:Uncharacterized protein n=1 Tax=Dermacentor silvarum TaxID=543639 RepID=A0ACB8CC71_DERSI|nr:hypothetical protein HPB49_023750 [Dermacentor silvarum]
MPPSVNGSSTSSARVRYTGFAVQLLDMVASALGLEYEIRASADGSDYGTLSAREGRWSGLVREVFEREQLLAFREQLADNLPVKGKKRKKPKANSSVEDVDRSMENAPLPRDGE